MDGEESYIPGHSVSKTKRKKDEISDDTGSGILLINVDPSTLTDHVLSLSFYKHLLTYLGERVLMVPCIKTTVFISENLKQHVVLVSTS